MGKSVFNGRGKHRSEFEVVPSAVAVSLHHGDSSLVVASPLFHVESVKYPAKISQFTQARAIIGARSTRLDTRGVTLVESIAVTENGCLVVTRVEYLSSALESKGIVL